MQREILSKNYYSKYSQDRYLYSNYVLKKYKCIFLIIIFSVINTDIYEDLLLIDILNIY